jgi:large conductance mechanosensitive channel
MSIASEFKEFAVKGNVIDMAVGIIIGAEFGKIINSMVNDIIMPPIGRLIGNVNFSELYVDLSGSGATTLAEAKKLGAATLNYGHFITVVINFTIMAFAIFMMVKAINRLKGAPKEEAKA